MAWDYLLRAAAYDPVADEWRRLPDPPLDSMECGPASVPAGDDTFGDYCGGLVVFDAGEDRWTPVPARPGTRSWQYELVEAGPVVLLLGWSTEGGERALLAYRHP